MERDSDILSDPRQDKPNTGFHHSDEGENHSVDKEVSEEVLPTGPGDGEAGDCRLGRSRECEEVCH